MNYVGMPHALKLQVFAMHLFEVFNATAYLVGSATRVKNYRDIDIRIILDDNDFIARYGALPCYEGFKVAKWNAECLAFSLLGIDIVGRLIDFQVQAQEQVDTQFKEGERIPLVDYRM